MSDIGVMHIVDSLALGGAERAAVDLVNSLPRDRYRSFLCTTRSEGPLANAVAADVGRIALERKSRFGLLAIRSLVSFIGEQRIAILHAHGSSLFVAVVAACFPPYPFVVWHAHYGRLALENHRAWVHRLATCRVRAIITVNRQLAEWCGRRLAFPFDRIWSIPNMVSVPESVLDLAALPGTSGSRIVCVANLREEKDHLNLVRAMKMVVGKYPAAHLLLVGAHSDPNCSAPASYFERVKLEITKNHLEYNITFFGQRRDIPAILRGCDIGVLGSRTEGLPVSLLEYGMAGLPVVATDVGECAEVLDYGRAGVVAPAQSPSDLAKALISLLSSREHRELLGERFHLRVREVYSAKSIVGRICNVYRSVLQSNCFDDPCRESAQDSLVPERTRLS